MNWYVDKCWHVDKLMFSLTPKSLLQVGKCQKLRHLDVGDGCAGGLSTRRGHAHGDGVGEWLLRLQNVPFVAETEKLRSPVGGNPVACKERWVLPPEGRLGPFPRASCRCFMRRAKTAYVSRTYSLLEDRWMAYVLVGCSCFTTTYLCLKSEDMLPSPSSIFNL